MKKKLGLVLFVVWVTGLLGGFPILLQDIANGTLVISVVTKATAYSLGWIIFLLWLFVPALTLMYFMDKD